MKKFKVLILLTLILIFFTGCKKDFSDIQTLVDKDIKKVETILKQDRNKGIPLDWDGKVLTWLCQDMGKENRINIDLVNNYLGKLNKDYRIKLRLVELDKNNFLIGKAYLEAIEKIYSKEDLDIINFGFMQAIGGDELVIWQLVEKGYLKELPVDIIPGVKAFLIDGRLYGLGNRRVNKSIGFFYPENSLDDAELEGIDQHIWNNKQIIKEKSVFLNHPYKDFSKLNFVYSDLIVIDPIDGKVDYFFNTEEYEAMAQGISELRKKGLLIGPFDDRKDNKIISVKESQLQEIQWNDKNKQFYGKYNGTTGIYLPFTIPYSVKNPVEIENGILSNTKFYEEALDFLKLLYTDKKMGEGIVADKNREEEIIDIGQLWRYFGDNLLVEDEIIRGTNITFRERFEEEYPKDITEGFYFRKKGLENYIKASEEIIYLDEFNNRFSEDMKSLMYFDTNWEEARANLSKLLSQETRDYLLQEVKNQFRKFSN